MKKLAAISVSLAIVLGLPLPAVSTPPMSAQDTSWSIVDSPDIRLDRDHLSFDCPKQTATVGIDPGHDGLALYPNSANGYGDSADPVATPTGNTEYWSACGQPGNVGLGNPAAVYCQEMGYTYRIAHTEHGDRGICVLPDGTECDDWAFYRGECGRELSLCATRGHAIAPEANGDEFASESSVCLLPDGSQKTISELLGLRTKAMGGQKRTSNRGKDTQRTPGPLTGAADRYDWRDQNGQDWMTPVRNQGICAGCWAFAALGVVESVYNISSWNSRLDLDLSEQYLVADCTDTGNCCGGRNMMAFLYVQQNGIPDENCLPYVDGSGCSCGTTCSASCTYRTGRQCSDTTCSDRCDDWQGRLHRIDVWDLLFWHNRESIKQHLIDKGPLSAAMWLGSGGWWDSGVYRCTDDSKVNHSVVIVGYDDIQHYWIIKNSWGTGWQDNGYFNVGYGECSIETQVAYASVTIQNCETITVYNDGTADLIVSDVQVGYEAGGSMSWLDTDVNSFTVPPSSSQQIDVCVDCRSACGSDTQHGWLEIHSDDPDESPVSVSVTAQCNNTPNRVYLPLAIKTPRTPPTALVP